MAASYEAKARGVCSGMGGGQGTAAVPRGGGRARAGSRRTPRRARRSFAIFEDTAPDCGGDLDRRGVPRRARHGALRRHGEEIAARLRREVREEVGLPISVGVAETKFLAKVASAVAKPDGLLVVPPGGELGVSSSAAGRAALGRRAGHLGAAARRRHRDRAAMSPSCSERALVELLGRGAGRHLHALSHGRDPRRVRAAPAAALDRRPARAGPAVAHARGGGRRARGARGPRLRAAAHRAPRLPDGGAAAALQRLQARHPLAHARRDDATGPRWCSPPHAALLAAAAAADRGARDHAGGRRAVEPRGRGPRPAAARRPHRDARLDADDLRDRFGTDAITRAVLLDHEPGPDVPRLPD